MPVFWGFYSLNVVGYCGDSQKHILGLKHAFWRIDRADRSRNATWARAEESKKKEKQDKKLSDVTNHVCAQTTHAELPPPKLSCGVGSQT